MLLKVRESLTHGPEVIALGHNGRIYRIGITDWSAEKRCIFGMDWNEVGDRTKHRGVMWADANQLGLLSVIHRTPNETIVQVKY
jgi:hypothetical protein